MGIFYHNIIPAPTRSSIVHDTAHRVAARSTGRVPTINSDKCYPIDPAKQIVLPRTAFILTTTFCAVLTFLSLVTLALLLYREHKRKQQSRAAASWGRQSRIERRREEVDQEFKRIYGPGVLVQGCENPEWDGDEIKELEGARIGEMGVGGRTPKMQEEGEEGRFVGQDGGQKRKGGASTAGWRKSRVGSLFFDQWSGVWFPRR